MPRGTYLRLSPCQSWLCSPCQCRQNSGLLQGWRTPRSTALDAGCSRTVLPVEGGGGLGREVSTKTASCVCDTWEAWQPCLASWFWAFALNAAEAGTVWLPAMPWEAPRDVVSDLRTLQTPGAGPHPGQRVFLLQPQWPQPLRLSTVWGMGGRGSTSTRKAARAGSRRALISLGCWAPS